MAMAKTLNTWLDGKGTRYTLVPHPKTYSSRDSAGAAHVREDHVAKAVILKDGQGFLMVVIPADQWIKLHTLNDTLNRHLEMATEAEINTLFRDCQPGAVPPLGQAYGMETVLDESLTTLANVYLEAGDHEQLVHLSGDDFCHLMRGIRQGHFAHPH